MADSETIDTPTANEDSADNRLDQITGTTAETRAELIAKGKETLSGVVSSAVDAVKANPKTAAAIAVGTTAAVAGAAYGATRLAKSAKTPAKPRAAAKPRTAAKRAPAKRATAPKK